MFGEDICRRQYKLGRFHVKVYANPIRLSSRVLGTALVWQFPVGVVMTCDCRK